MQIVRIVGFVLSLVAALVCFLTLGPDDVTRFQPIAVEGNQQLIDQALADYEANSTAGGEDVDLQIMANGWVARDMLFILANEFDALSQQLSVTSAQIDAIAAGTQPDDRVPSLVLIGVLTLAFHAATIPFVTPIELTPARRRAAPSDDAGRGVSEAEHSEPLPEEE